MSSETPVRIGLVGHQVPDDDHTAAEALSKFGGRPVWIDGQVPDGFPFICSICGADLDFVCQIATPYCANKRCLYLFGCHKQTACGKRADGWTVVRGVVEPPAPERAEEKIGDNSSHCQLPDQGTLTTDASDWLQAAFGYEAPSNSCSENRCRQNEKTCVPEAPVSQTPWHNDVQQTVDELMPAFFVRIEDEPPDNSKFDATGVRARQLQLEYEQREAQGSAEEAEGNQNSIAEAEAYEESPDKVFLKLQKRLSRSPKQAIRYSFEGKPLFISPLPKGEVASVPPCPHCGSSRVFEMQLVPAAAEEIEKRYAARTRLQQLALDERNAGRKDCVPTGIYTTEHVIVQEIL